MFHRRALMLVWMATLAAGQGGWDDAAGTTDGPKEPSSETRCQKGVCAGQEYLVFSQMDTEAKCADTCFRANWNSGAGCKYYTYSSETKNCFQYSQCETVGTAEFKNRGLIYLEVGDIKTYKTCKFTKFMKDVWLDLKGAPASQSSTGWGGVPQRASDGNMASNWGGASCTHTHRNNKAWWEVTIPVKQTCSVNSTCPERQKCVDGVCKADGLPLVNLGGSGCTSSKKCTACKGDCDKDADCASGLVCFQRNGFIPVPGCIEGGSGDTKDYDYCFDPSKVKGIPLENLGGSGCTSRNKCTACKGDCDRDSDCASGLKCFQRNGHESVPGCKFGGSGDAKGYDYCYAPEASWSLKCEKCTCPSGEWLGGQSVSSCAETCSQKGSTSFKHASGTKPNGEKGDDNCGCCTSSSTEPENEWGVNVYQVQAPTPASVGWTVKLEKYCSGNWGTDWGNRIPGKSVSECTRLCIANPNCKAITVGTHGGVPNNCVQCTSDKFSTAHWTTSYTPQYETSPCTTAADGNECLNGGTVSGTIGKCGCTCPSGWGGSNCQSATQKIDMVRVVNRGDCCERRLQSFKVKVDEVECATAGSTTRGEILDVPCKAEGSKVKIELTGNDYLTLCEVAVKYEEAVDISHHEWFM